MTDKQEPEKVEPDTEGGEDERESAFWKKFDARLDEGVKRAVEQYVGRGTSRSGRTTLPGLIADMFYGKQPQK